jgi:hypothetical protein
LFENETKILKIKIGVLHLSMLETSNFVLTLNCSEKKKQNPWGIKVYQPKGRDPAKTHINRGK